MEVVADLIGSAKTNTNVFYKDTTKKLAMYWTGGSYLMLRIKPRAPRGRSIIAIWYKYNARKDLSFIVIDNTCITQANLTYLSKYPDQLYNVSILLFCIIVVYNRFGYVNEVKFHKK